MRDRTLTGVLLAIAIVAGPVAAGGIQAPAGAGAATLVGAWTLNRDLSDSPPDREGDAADGERGRRGDRERGGGGGRGGGGRGGGRGGFGGGGRRAGGAGDRAAVDPQEVARLRDALRDIVNPGDQLTIVQTEAMVIITGSDGRTMRLSPDGTKIKDESTKSERRTKWEGGKLVSEIGGLPGGKVTQTFAVDPERRQLHITVTRDDDRRPLKVHRIYDFSR